jgi:hypothetical protein
MNLELEVVQKLGRDLSKAAVTLSLDEVRFLVDAYYIMQKDRIRSSNQVRALGENQEPHEVLRWLAEQSTTLENQIKRALDKWTDGQEMGKWCKGITGLGPVITAGLLAHIDITKAPTVGHIWRFGGLDPTSKWKKGEKRPWNASLKVILWKLGQSFVKVSNNENDVYGKVYAARKAYEIEKNARLEYKAQAEAILASKKIGKETTAYEHYSLGMLPPAHIQQRAERYAVKLFLSHFHEKAYWLEYGIAPPLPYPIAMLSHAHKK